MIAPVIAPVIAIDGPAGAGKSTAARRLAERLGFFLLDTGAIYRSLAWWARKCGVAWDDAPRLAELAGAMAIEFQQAAEGQHVLVGTLDVTRAIREPEISDGASRVSAHAAVRAALLELQRGLARRGRCVVEGRDIGTVVLPWAPLKLFVTATPEARAHRRHLELLARGLPSDEAQTLADLRERDRRDETRAQAPLRCADDAIVVDTSRLTLDEVVDRLVELAREKLPGHVFA